VTEIQSGGAVGKKKTIGKKARIMYVVRSTTRAWRGQQCRLVQTILPEGEGFQIVMGWLRNIANNRGRAGRTYSPGYHDGSIKKKRIRLPWTQDVFS